MTLWKHQVDLIPPGLVDTRGGSKGLHALLQIVCFGVGDPLKP